MDTNSEPAFKARGNSIDKDKDLSLIGFRYLNLSIEWKYQGEPSAKPSPASGN
jgi:hypothetical protein